MHLHLLLLLLLLISPFSLSLSTTERDTLMAIRDSLDPENRVLISWTPHSNPCYFEGVACNEKGVVSNISLQGKGLYGRIPEALAGLKSLKGLYLHFNSLTGNLPKEIASLTQLSDLYLSVNNLSGHIPPQIGNMSNLQVLQLCYNKLSGNIPTELGRLRKLSVVALQYNQLSGAIPASLGEVETLERLDLSFNGLFGPIPVTLANAPTLHTLDIRNNSLSGIVPTALGRLKGGFQYINNPGLCGTGFAHLDSCKAVSNSDPVRPEPYEPEDGDVSTKDLPASIEPKPENCCERTSSKSSKFGLVFLVIGVIIVASTVGLILVLLLWHCRQKQNNVSDCNQLECKISASSLISLEYSKGWDPLAKGGRSGYSEEVLESFMFNLEEVERATHSFSEANLLVKSNFWSIYQGKLRDGSVVVIKCIANTSCKCDESEFLKGLMTLTSLRHENLVRLRGFCCSKGRGECFLVYDDSFSNGSLLQYLDVKRNSGRVLEWSIRVFIIRGIAKGINYLHKKEGSKDGVVHQNISVENILLDAEYNALLADSALHKILADDAVFSALKGSAAMGYLPPEYAKTGRLTETSDVYAFGVIVFQLLTGKRDLTQLSCQLRMESVCLEDVVDENLEGKFSESEATTLRRVALLCTHESPYLRPSMDNVIQELAVPHM